MKVEFFRHSINNQDIGRTSKVLRSIFLTTGKAVAEFERRFALYLNVEDVVGVTSCTAALHLSLLTFIKPGDEVITSPMSFCATANAILHAGGIPVFVDVEEETGNIDADLIEAAITKKTKVILPVHLYGQMCDMVKIKKIANKHKLAIIEDAAHAIEASREGFKPGMLSDAACFSFYATKNITSGKAERYLQAKSGQGYSGCLDFMALTNLPLTDIQADTSIGICLCLGGNITWTIFMQHFFWDSLKGSISYGNEEMRYGEHTKMPLPG